MTGFMSTTGVPSIARLSESVVWSAAPFRESSVIVLVRTFDYVRAHT